MPHGFQWDYSRGQWVDTDGIARPEATRKQRRVLQRQASEMQTLRHKHKWQLYDSCERRRSRWKGKVPMLTAQEQKARPAQVGAIVCLATQVAAHLEQ